MRSLVPALAGLAALMSGAAASAAPSSSPPIEASALHLRYGVSLIGLPIGTASVDGTIGAAGYRLEGAGKLTGLAGIIVDTKGAVTAAGTLAGGHVNPASFAASAGTPNYLLTIRMAMEHGTATGVEITPMYQQTPDRIPVTPADRRNIIDPMSSLIMAVPGTGEVIGPQSCNRTIPIFDGGVRFNVLLAYTGTRQVTSSAYTGPVAVCAARYQPISGYRPNRPVNKFMADNKQMETWLAPVGKSRFVVPYRISVMSMIGMVVIEATDFTISPAAKAEVSH